MLELAVLEAATGRRRRFRRRSPTALPLAVLVLGVLVFLWVALLATRVIALPGLEHYVSVEDWAVYGAVLLLLLLVVLVVWMVLTRSQPVEEYLAPLPTPTGARWDADEIVVTAEDWHGLRVLEYSRPPKSEVPSAVYAKVLVPLDAQYVLRVEDRVAEARE